MSQVKVSVAYHFNAYRNLYRRNGTTGFLNSWALPQLNWQCKCFWGSLALPDTLFARCLSIDDHNHLAVRGSGIVQIAKLFRHPLREEWVWQCETTSGGTGSKIEGYFCCLKVTLASWNGQKWRYRFVLMFFFWVSVSVSNNWICIQMVILSKFWRILNSYHGMCNI